MQLTCRDRNRLALEAEIAGAALHGIENICCLTGDDVTAGDEPEARRVFDLDSIQLLALGALDGAGHVSLRPQDRPGAAALPRRGREPGRAAVRLPRRARAGRRSRAGARFLQLQVSFEPERLAAFMGEAVDEGARRPRARSSRRSASSRSPSALRYMDENVPGITVPRGDDRARASARPTRRRRASRSRASSPSTRARCRASPGLHLISFRREAGIAAALPAARAFRPREEREMSGYRRPVAV